MNELKQLTWADFDKFNPCYSPQDKYGDFSGTILDILNDERIPANDKIWAATREGILDDRTLRLFACKCVREIWHLLTDERSRNAVEVAEKYANGEATYKELSVAREDAPNAMIYADIAATAAARDAARAASWIAASAAASGAARDKQIQLLIQTINETR